MSSGALSRPDLPAVDARLVMPESRYEIEDGRIRYVAPADEPHATRHAKLTALLEAHVGDDFDVACDMLTRTSELEDMAPDASVFPRARNPETGGRQIEELAFEVASTESLADAGRKAHKLVARGVRRVFVIDVERRRAFEWSGQLTGWRMLEHDGVIEDRTLAVALPIEALVRAAKADDAMARALLGKHNPVLEATLAQREAEGEAKGRAEGEAKGRAEGEAKGRAEGEARGRVKAKAEAVVTVLNARAISLDSAQRERILSEQNLPLLERWLAAAARCSSVDELFE